MIYLKSSEDIKAMRRSGRILQEVFEKLESFIRPGISTKDIDRIAEETIRSRNAYPSFLKYGDPPFPASVCVSINEEVVHGIPSSKRILKQGDIVSVDVGAYLDGFHADAARTYPVGDISPEKQKLMDVTRECFFKGFEQILPGNRIGDISAAIEEHAKAHRYGIVKELTGHGIGKNLHEEPDVPNYVTSERGIRIETGLAIAIEPMINMGTHQIFIREDNWTVVTRDLKPSAHYENTVVMTPDGPEMMTEANG